MLSPWLLLAQVARAAKAVEGVPLVWYNYVTARDLCARRLCRGSLRGVKRTAYGETRRTVAKGVGVVRKRPKPQPLHSAQCSSARPSGQALSAGTSVVSAYVSSVDVRLQLDAVR